MVSLAALALLALPLAITASTAPAPHYSLPRRAHDLAAPHARAAVRYRALPRTGRRLSKRGAGGDAGTEATLKCLTAHTFALCDGDRCTDMGAVAAGTMCKDGAITWDTTSEASSEDSSAATVSYAVEVPSSSSTAAAAVVDAPEPSSSSSAEAAAAEETLSAAQPLANNVAVQTSSAAAAPAATASAVDSVQLNVGLSSSDDDDDWECDSDDVSSSSTAWTPAASSSSTAVDNVQLNAKPTTTTTTTQAPAQTSAAATSSGGSGTTYTGRGTYYYQYGTAGSCGNVASDSDYVVALSYTQVDGGKHCGEKVQLTNTQNGKTVVATVADTCPGCSWGSIDLSEGAFLQLGTLDQGVLPLSWKYVS